MKQSSRVILCSLILLVLETCSAGAGVLKNWTNTSGGNWFDPLNWSPSAVPTNGDAVTITNSGTYTVYAATGTVTCAVFTIGGGTGKQTFVYGSPTGGQLFVTNSSVQNNGVLVITNGGVTGPLLVKPSGELQLYSSGILQLYTFALTNQGTVTWSGGSLQVGGSNTNFSYFTNSGLWQITGDVSLFYGGGGRNVLFNAGTIRKSAGTGTGSFAQIDLINLPTGLVDVLSGTLQFSPYFTNNLSGSFTATAPAVMKFVGNETDAGATMSGTGSFQFGSGTFYLQTNTIANLKFVGGDIYVTGTTTFQQAGAITNLALDGANLRGTNRIAGTVTVNSGNLIDYLTVLPGGQLLIPSAFSQLYGWHLVNQGIVNWSGAYLQVGNTSISNGGTWTMTGDGQLSNGGSAAYFTNSGTLQKTSGTGTSEFDGATFFNQPSGIVRATTGTLQMPFNYTNTAGELQLNGGTLTVAGTLGMTGGVLDGSGTIGVAAAFDGGTVAPGTGTGLIQFKSSLSLGTNVTLALDGIGTVPGLTYDQLSVTGAVSISNCTLQVTSLPSVPVGTTFVIITNTTANSTTGTFNGLPENAQLTISGQPFRLHYSGGNGNDVVLVRDSSGPVKGPQVSGGYTNKTFKLLGVGSGATIYTIQGSTNLLQWTNLGLATGDIGGNFIFTDTNATNFRYRFYRTTN